MINRFQNVSTGIEKWHAVSSTRFCVKLQLFSVSFMTNEWDAKMASRPPCAALTLCMIMCHHGIDEILDLERKWSIFCYLELKNLIFISRCSWLSRFRRYNSCFPPKFVILKKISLLEWMRFEENFSSRMNEILQTDSLSLLEIQNFERKITFSSWFFPQFLFQFSWEIIFCSLGWFWPSVFCRKGKYFKKTVLWGGWRRGCQGVWHGWRVRTEEEK